MSDPAPSATLRTGASRDRHGRGLRGPLAMGTPLDPDAPRPASPRAEFDAIVLAVVERLGERWGDELGDVEFGTEDVPEIPPEWGDEPVPFGALVKARPGRPARIVVFRRPVEMRAKSRLERMALVNEILADHIAELLGRDPGEIG